MTRRLLLPFLIILFSISCFVPVFSQKCFEGDCTNGYGKYDWPTVFAVAHFTDSTLVGPGLVYWKESGVVDLGNYNAQGSPTFQMLEYQSGALQFGPRAEVQGANLMYNGFTIDDKGGFSRMYNADRTELHFKFDRDSCLIGDCKNGFGGEFLIVLTKSDTTSYLYAGNYKNGAWDGEGGYYEYTSGNFYVGTFANNIEWTGAIFNHEQGLAQFIMNGKSTKMMSYSIPATPPGADAKPVVKPVVEVKKEVKKEKQRGGFWKVLGDVLTISAAVLEEDAKNSKKKRAAQSSNASGALECLYMVRYWTANDDMDFVLQGPSVIQKSSRHLYEASNSARLVITFFNSSQAAQNYKQEKAIQATSQGFEIKYSAPLTPIDYVRTKGCVNK